MTSVWDRVLSNLVQVGCGHLALAEAYLAVILITMAVSAMLMAYDEWFDARSPGR